MVLTQSLPQREYGLNDTRRTRLSRKPSIPTIPPGVQAARRGLRGALAALPLSLAVIALSLAAASCSNPLATEVASLQEVAVSPVITVKAPDDSVLSNGDTINFGTKSVGVPSSLTLTIVNTGRNDLSINVAGITVTPDSSTANSVFTVQTGPAGTVPASESTSLVLQFLPNSDGSMTASIEIPTNDALTPLFSVNFSGVGSPVLLTTNDVSSITWNSATGGGTISDDGGNAITERGVCWSTSVNPTIADGKSVDTGTGTGSYSVSLTGLSPETYYYYCAYATNSAGITYGPSVGFSTSAAPVILITTTAVSSITRNSAIGGGTISDNGATITERGVCWGTSANPTVADSTCVDTDTGTGTYSASLTGLSPDTTYYYRAYATNSAGTTYGSSVTFTTAAANVAITTSSVSSITWNSAIGGGTISDDGGNAITERGVCWGTSANPTIADSTSVDTGTGTGSYSVSLTGLSPSTTYYYRAYATNSAGTTYGSSVTFTTAAPTVAITTSSVTAITWTSATSGGTITTNDGPAITERGVCWGTSANPTIADSTSVDGGSGTGTYAAPITGLAPGTYYYCRAYATSSVGTTYGLSVGFSTTAATAPTTTAPSAINATTAAAGGTTIADDGVTISAYGVCWNTTGSPTIADSHTADGSGVGSFTSSLTGLTYATTYYVRAYATNQGNTVYGAQVSLKTVGYTDSDGYYVFYDAGEASLTDNGWRYMAVAPASQETTGALWWDPWIYDNSTLDWTSYYAAQALSTSSAVGTGKENTANIIAAVGTTSTGYCAYVCASYTGGGHSDWFLPSQGELQLLYNNLKAQGLGDFSGTYWSSTKGTQVTSYCTAYYGVFATSYTEDGAMASYYTSPYNTWHSRAVRRY